MAERAMLTVDIKGYWHPGTGRGQGTQLDATTHRGGDGLPALPGRTVKGLVRDAVRRWERWGGYGDGTAEGAGVAEQLFGPRHDGDETWPGLLRFSDATLPPAEASYLEAHPDLLSGLYREHFATAIEPESGTARPRSLRGIEVVVPLTLQAEVEVVSSARHDGLYDRWPDILREALPLVRAVGAHRSRGLGRAVLTVQEATQ